MTEFCQLKPFSVVIFSVHIWRLLIFFMERYGVWYKCTQVSEESAASIFRIVMIIIMKASNITVTQRLTELCSEKAYSVRTSN